MAPHMVGRSVASNHMGTVEVITPYARVMRMADCRSNESACFEYILSTLHIKRFHPSAADAMSWSRPANRRLLWSILHAPGQPPSSCVHAARISTRLLSTSTTKCFGGTFSFGPEGDNIILKQAPKRPPKDRADDKQVIRAHEGSTAEDKIPDKKISAKNKSTAGINEEGSDGAIPHAETHGRQPVSSNPSAEERASSIVPTVEEGLDVSTSAATDQRHNSVKVRRTDKRPREAMQGAGKTSETSSTARRTSKTSSSSRPPRKTFKSKTEDALSHLQPDRESKPDRPNWAIQKSALADKFGPSGWNPRRKLSPDALLGIRNMHASDPATYTTAVLAQQFKVSAEAIRRVLKSKWLSNAGADKVQERRERWAKRHDRIWDTQAELGLRPAREGERRARDASEGVEEVEHELWARETLERAREENPIWKGKKV